VSGQDAAQKPAGEAPAADPEGKKPATGDAQEKPRSPRSFERRIDRLHKRAAEAEARAQLYEKQLAEARQQGQPQADPAAPKLEQFDYDPEKYAQAKAKYEADKALKEHTAKQQQETQKQQQQRLVSEWEERSERAEEKYPDFQEVVGEIAPNHPLGRAIMQVDNGEDVAYHLGKNLKEAQRIAGLDPFSQVLEIGKLSAKLAAQPAKPPKQSQAPAPIAPLSGAATPPNGEPDPSADYGAWLKWRQARVHGARAR
jgi:exonuclease VII large subunit